MEPSNFHRGHRPSVLFPLEPLPSRRGLFDMPLSRPALAHMSEKAPDPGAFKHGIWEEYDFHQWGWPYDYEADLDYKMKIGHISRKINDTKSNLIFLHELKQAKMVLLPEFLMQPQIMIRSGPVEAPKPDSRDRSAYVWPSYIVWSNDPSYLSFLGSPETMELPKNVLRETRGHPKIRNEPSAHYRPGIQRPWRI